jgi:hypothetical protein
MQKINSISQLEPITLDVQGVWGNAMIAKINEGFMVIRLDSIQFLKSEIDFKKSYKGGTFKTLRGAKMSDLFQIFKGELRCKPKTMIYFHTGKSWAPTGTEIFSTNDKFEL